MESTRDFSALKHLATVYRQQNVHGTREFPRYLLLKLFTRS